MFKQTASGYSEGSVFTSLFWGVRLAENVSNARKFLFDFFEKEKYNTDKRVAD